MIGPTDITAIFGQRGSGKSDLGKAISRLYPRLFAIDITSEWECGRDDLDLVTDSFDVAARFLEETIGEKQFRMAFQFDIDTASDTQRKTFNALLRTLYKRGTITGENLCLLIEEVHFYCSPATIEEWLFKMVTVGRHANVPMIVSSQRPAQVHKSITSAAPNKFIGQLDDGRDLKYFREIIGDLADEIPKLDKYDFIYHRLGAPPRVVDKFSFTEEI